MRNPMRKIVMTGLMAMLVQIPFPGNACSGVLTIWADQFKVALESPPESPTVQNPNTLTGNGWYYYIFKLPARTKIRYIQVNYHKPDGTRFDWCVYLRRIAPDQPYENLIKWAPAPEDIPAGDGSLKNPPESVLGSLSVSSSYRYYIEYEPSEEGSLYSIQVFYKD